MLAVHLAEMIGGAEHLLLHLLKGNQRERHVDYHVVFLHDGPLPAMISALGYPVDVFEAGEVPELHKFAYTTARLAAHLVRTDPGLVMAWKGGSHLYASLAGQLVGRPEVWWQQAIPLGCRSDRILTLMPTSGIICVSNASAAAQRRMSPRRPTPVIYPCVDPDLFDPSARPSPSQARALLGIPLDRQVVGMLARLVPGKGPDFFLRAAAIVAKQFPRAVFALVGGQQRGHFEAFAEQVKQLPGELGIDDRVIMPGHVSNPGLWLQAMDVVVQAATQPESFGMVVAEAMALGKPVVASRVGGPEEIVTEEINGLLTSPGNPGELALAMARLLDDPDMANRLGRAGTIRARDFHRDRFVARVTATVRELVEL